MNDFSKLVRLLHWYLYDYHWGLNNFPAIENLKLTSIGEEKQNQMHFV